VPVLDVTMADIPDLHRVLAELRAEAPVAPIRCYGAPAWIILTYEGLRDALRDEDTFPSEASYSKNTDPAVGRTLNSMRGAEHNRNRSVVSPTFRKQRMAAYGTDFLEPMCRSLVERFAGRDELDLREVFTHLFPMVVITQLLGLPWDDYEALERWSNALFTYPSDPQGALAARAEFTEFLEAIMETRRVEPADDLISTLVTGEFQGRTLEHEEILSFLRLLFPAGTHNTTNAIGNMFFALLEHPDLMARVREEPETRHWAVEETLRWEPSVGNLPRQACAEGAEWGGVELPPDAAMVYSFSAANRDPAMFRDPDRFDLDRHPQEMLTFGLGEHFCLGAWLARQEMRVALDVLLDSTRHIALAEVDAASPRGGSLRGPEALPVIIDW
jgi:cytochrome P450